MPNDPLWLRVVLRPYWWLIVNSQPHTQELMRGAINAHSWNELVGHNCTERQWHRLIAAATGEDA